MTRADIHSGSAPAHAADASNANLRVDENGALYVVVSQGGVQSQIIPSEQTLLASAARTATVNTEVTNAGHKGVIVFIDTTVDPASASITPHIEGKSSLSNEWYTILTGAAIAGVGNVVLRVYPGAVAVSNLVADDQLPAIWRFRMAVADTDSMTYSVNAILLP